MISHFHVVLRHSVMVNTVHRSCKLTKMWHWLLILILLGCFKMFEYTLKKIFPWTKGQWIKQCKKTAFQSQVYLKVSSWTPPNLHLSLYILPLIRLCTVVQAISKWVTHTSVNLELLCTVLNQFYGVSLSYNSAKYFTYLSISCHLLEENLYQHT